MARRIGYARTAIDDPDLVLQIYELEQASCNRVYADRETNAAAEGRLGWRTCLDSLSRGDTLVVSRIERLARTLIELNEVLTTLGERQVALRICHWAPAPNIDPEDLAEIVQRLVDFESENSRELIRAGIATARAEGRVGGRRHKLKPEQIKELQALMALPGADVVTIAKRFGIGRATAYKYVHKATD
jgi:DNA invertase Pin-like site-specific DNA recombinase